MEEKRPLKFGGNWTAEKLDSVGKYLKAYTTALKSKPFHLIYIDAFAGSGYCGKQDGIEPDIPAIPELAADDTTEFLRGSTRVALDVEPPFAEYIFIDRDPTNCIALDKLRDEYPDKKDSIRIAREDANSLLKRMANDNWRNKRAVLFLDPYGMQVEWATIQSIARTKSIDVWYLFPLAAVNRLLRKDADIGEAERKRLDYLFGTTDWADAFYRSEKELSLFGEYEITEKTATFDSIKDYVIKRLQSEFPGVAENPLILRNSRNSPLFLLCFAASNEKGAPIAIRIAQHILRKK